MTVMPFSLEADLLARRRRGPSSVAIRREDKGPSERRAPLTPDHVARLAGVLGMTVAVESSARRIFPDSDYERAGAGILPSIRDPQLILGVKEPDPGRLIAGATYMLFAHVTKGQPANMPTLRRMMELGNTLIDYEQIVDDSGRRLIFFGQYAGYAGAINALWALGQRLHAEGIVTPFSEMRLAHEYEDLDEALAHVRSIGSRIRMHGLPATLRPVVFAIIGSGNVASGAEHVLEYLRPHEIRPDELASFPATREVRRQVFLARLPREVRYERLGGGPFDANDYSQHPAAYGSALTPYLRHVTVLFNGTYWEEGMPRLVGNDQLDELWCAESQPVLRVIADITCDVGGSIEANVGATTPSDPVYVFAPRCRRNGEVTIPGVRGQGPVLMTVDNLPAQVPSEASQGFGAQLLPFLRSLASCDWNAPLAELRLEPELRRAVILHRGRLTPDYAYLEKNLR